MALIVTEICSAFSSESIAIQPLHGSILEVEEVPALTGDDIFRVLHASELVCNGDVMDASDGLTKQGSAWLHIVATEPSKAVQALEDFFLDSDLYKVKSNGGLGNPDLMPKVFGQGGDLMTFWRFQPDNEILKQTAERFGPYFRVMQLIEFAARAGNHT